MKRIWILLLLLALLLGGCRERNQWSGYDGTMENYSYCYPEGRNREWEEDFLYLAEVCLNTHPYLMDEACWTYIYREPFSCTQTAYSREIFRQETRDRFLEQVNQVICQIPECSDTKLAWEARRLIAQLGDIHSGLNPVSEGEPVFPLGLAYFAGDTGYTFYAVAVPEIHGAAYLGKLISINDIPVETIVEKLVPYVSAENDFYPVYAIGGFRSQGLLCRRNALHAVGVLDADATSARFAFETEAGTVECMIETVAAEEYTRQELLRHPMYAESWSLFRSNDHYWYEWLEENVLYLRLASLREEADCSFLSYMVKVGGELRQAPQPVRVILDFRYNTGGPPHERQWQYFLDAIKNCETDGVYLLINGNCISSGVAAPYQLSEAIPGAKLVGTPTAQFPNSPAGQTEYKLPNAGFSFFISQSYSMFAPDKQDTALYPEITVEQTWEDYVNCKDTVLDYVRNLP